MESYRITRWPEPLPTGPALPVRKALAAMSVGWVTRRILEREARMSRREVDTLLDTLDEQGALARSDDVLQIWSEPVGVAAATRGLLSRVSRRLVDVTRRRRAWWAADLRAADPLPTQGLIHTTAALEYGVVDKR